MTFDMNDVEPQRSGGLIPDGTFAKLVMTLRKGGTYGMSEVDRGLLKASNQPGSNVLMLDAEFNVAEGRMPGASSGRTSPCRTASWMRRANRSAEDLHVHLPRDDRQRTAVEPRRHERGREGQARAARARRSRRDQLRGQDQDRAEPEPRLQERQQA